MDKKLSEIVEGNRTGAVKFLQKMVSFDSQVINQGVKGQEGEIQKWLIKELEGMGCEVDVFEPDNEKIGKYEDFNSGHDYAGRPNVVGTLRGTGGGRSLILNGHVDVVPLGNRNEWKHDPWGGEIVEGKMFGRGTADMKAGVAAMITAVKCLIEAGIKLKGDVIIQSVVDEEGGGNGTLACVDKGYRADAAIVTEPTCLAIMPTHRGAMHLKIATKGKATHACFKWKGVNAIEKMLKIINGLDALEKTWLASKHHPLLPSPTLMCGWIQGGTGASSVPADCEIKVNVKYLPGEKAQDVRKEVEDCIANVVQSDPWLKQCPPLVKWTLNTPPYETRSDHPIVKTIYQAASQIVDKPVISGLPSGADARLLNNLGGIPTLIFGPGSLQDAHGIDEYVSMDEYQKTISTLTETIRSWCG